MYLPITYEVTQDIDYKLQADWHESVAKFDKKLQKK